MVPYFLRGVWKSCQQTRRAPHKQWDPVLLFLSERKEKKRCPVNFDRHWKKTQKQKKTCSARLFLLTLWYCYYKYLRPLGKLNRCFIFLFKSNKLLFDLYILSYRNDFDIVWPLRIIALESRSSLLVDSELKIWKTK